MNNGSDPNTVQTPPAADELSMQSAVNSENSLETPAAPGSVSQPEPVEPPRRMSRRRIVGLALLGLGLIAGVLMVLYAVNAGKRDTAGSQLLNTAARIKPQSVALPTLSSQLETAAQELNTLTINGQASVSDSLVLQPIAQPDDAVTGQIYYDRGTNQLAFYNGERFVNLQGAVSTQVINVIGGDTITNIVAGDTITNTTNVTNVIGGGLSGSGTTGTLAMFTGGTSLGNSLISQSGSTLNVGADATAIQIGATASNHTIQVGTGAGMQQVTVGSTSTTSSSVLQAGTGGLTLHTGDNAGVSGDISITTGNSSTTASGNITIDAGSGIVDGELVSSKTFEAGLDNFIPWFGVTVAQSTAQAHSGIYSLEETATTPFNGILENINFPITAVTPGHQYFFSYWVRAATTPRTISVRLNWSGSSTTVDLTPTVDSTSGWTEITGTAQAPAGANHVYTSISHPGTAGEVHYYDDFTIIDLSSAAAISALSIGATNAKILTIGNLNQIGATSIYGGSGITLNAGAGNLTATGGVMTLTGHAASSVSTTSGALTLTSAAAATWSIGPAAAGDGGNLTLRAGNAGSDDNNDGGSIILQGGTPNGTGLPGGIIVRPQTNTPVAFQIQDSATTPLFVADTTTSTLTISGTTSVFAKLVLTDTHFGSTQTTAPAIATPTNCGTAPSAVVTPGSTDNAGSFSITTGTGGTSSTCDTTITFEQPYAAEPKSILVVGKTDAASAARQAYVSAQSATDFTVSFGESAAGADSTTYEFSYWIVE